MIASLSKAVTCCLYADVEGGDWSGRATWLTSQHESQALATALPEGHQEQAPVLPLDVTIGFKRSESAGKPSKKQRKHGSHRHPHDFVLSTTIAATVVTRSEGLPFDSTCLLSAY